MGSFSTSTEPPRPDEPPERPLRRDAERNRERIIDAARIVFAERGLRGSHDDIAREAGVGVGTVYRRFPDKDQLIDALFEEAMQEIVGLAEEGLAIDDPWNGLVHFMVRAQELQCADRGLRELILGNDAGIQRVAAARDRIAPLAERLLNRAQAAGVVRDDVVATDLPIIQLAIGAIAVATRDVAPNAWRRTLTVIIDGLRVDRVGHPRGDLLGEPPLTLDQVDSAMRASVQPLRR